jgi:hypothetical protein
MRWKKDCPGVDLDIARGDIGMTFGSSTCSRPQAVAGNVEFPLKVWGMPRFERGPLHRGHVGDGRLRR